MKEGGEYPEMFDSSELIYASLMVIFVYFSFLCFIYVYSLYNNICSYEIKDYICNMSIYCIKLKFCQLWCIDPLS